MFRRRTGLSLAQSAVSEAVWDFFVEGNEDLEGGGFEISELREAGHDRVVARLQREVTGKTSGAAVTWEFGLVTTWRNEKALRFEWFTDRDEALEAAESP